MEKSKKAAGYVKSSMRTLDILELLAEHPDGLSFTEICNLLEMPLSSSHNLITTLTYRGYLVRTNRGSTLQLGPKLAQLNVAYHANNNLILLADSQMEKLRDVTGETTSLVVLQGARIVFIHKRPCTGNLQVINPVGTRLYAHSTGSGKTILANLPESEIDLLYPGEELPGFTPHTITIKTRLKEELATIREQGYAFDHQESEEGVWAVASCIWNQEGQPFAALSIVAPNARISHKDISSWPDLVSDCAAKISFQLGYTGGNSPPMRKF
jgi:DNA-binding IclR family transcriptional regulator